MNTIISMLEGIELETIVKSCGYYILWTLPLIGMIIILYYLEKPNSKLTKLIKRIVEKRMSKMMPQIELPKDKKEDIKETKTE